MKQIGEEEEEKVELEWTSLRGPLLTAGGDREDVLIRKKERGKRKPRVGSIVGDLYGERKKRRV